MDASIVRRPPFGTTRWWASGAPTPGAASSAPRSRSSARWPSRQARVELITERAGCSRPAFYQYFSSKDDVFWTLATQLGEEMVTLADAAGPVDPRRRGPRPASTAWIDDFMALHEAWAPVFASFQAASRDHLAAGPALERVSERTGTALLRAFGCRPHGANERLMAALVAVLIRCSFYAEAAPAGMSREPLVLGLAQLFHRVLAGPIEGVNLRRGRARPAPHRPAIAPPLPTGPHAAARPGASAPASGCSTPAPRCCPPAATTTPGSTTSSRRPG